jgi:hypothetical protein
MCLISWESAHCSVGEVLIQLEKCLFNFLATKIVGICGALMPSFEKEFSFRLKLGANKKISNYPDKIDTGSV